MDTVTHKAVTRGDLLYIAAAKTNAEQARRCGERSILIFPCRATGPRSKLKSPMTPHGFVDASCDPEVIARWWKRWPNALVGLPTGAATGLYIVDPDSPVGHQHDGLAAWAKLEAENGSVDTFTVRTSGGGLHKYFLMEPGLTSTSGKLAPGIETRGNGGYIILVGSRLPDGATWRIETDAEIAAIPPWLLAKLPGNGPDLYHNEAPLTARVGETPPGLRELKMICKRLAAADGDVIPQHQFLYRMSAEAGGLVGAGEVYAATAEDALLAGGLKMENLKPEEPWTKRQLLRVTRNGLRNGVKEPRVAYQTIEEFFAEQMERSREIYELLGIPWTEKEAPQQEETPPKPEPPKGEEPSGKPDQEPEPNQDRPRQTIVSWS
jgi:hypothetical protein